MIPNIRVSSTGDSSIDITVIKDGDVSTCFSTDVADRAPFVALDYSPYFPVVQSIEIKSRSSIGEYSFYIHHIMHIKIFRKKHIPPGPMCPCAVKKTRYKQLLILYSFTKYKRDDTVDYNALVRFRCARFTDRK